MKNHSLRERSTQSTAALVFPTPVSTAMMENRLPHQTRSVPPTTSEPVRVGATKSNRNPVAIMRHCAKVRLHELSMYKTKRTECAFQGGAVFEIKLSRTIFWCIQSKSQTGELQSCGFHCPKPSGSMVVCRQSRMGSAKVNTDKLP